jgi:hypothetical protein
VLAPPHVYPKHFRSSSPRRALAASSDGHHRELPMGRNSGNKTVRAGTPEGRAESMLNRAENRRLGDFFGLEWRTYSYNRLGK